MESAAKFEAKWKTLNASTSGALRDSKHALVVLHVLTSTFTITHPNTLD
jgi:hypothetical protein